MKHLLLTTIAAVLVAGCGESQQSAPAPEANPVEPVAEAAQPELPTVKAPDISILNAAAKGNIDAIKQHLAAGTDVNSKDKLGRTSLHYAAYGGHKKTVELLIAEGADVNAQDGTHRWTPLYWAAWGGHKEIAELLLAEGASLNTRANNGGTPLDFAIRLSTPYPSKRTEIANLFRKHGGKTGEELKAEGK